MRLLFIGTHGQKNLGDELLLQVFVNKLKNNVDEWYINSYQPEITKDMLDMENVSTFHTRKQPLLLLYYLYKCDVVVFGGGSIIKELYSEYGGKPYATLYLLLGITFIAKKVFNKPIIMSNIGAGPLKTAKATRLTKSILENVDYITVRDSISVENLNKVKSAHTINLVPDAAFSITKCFLGLKGEHHPVDKNRIIIGINLCRNIGNNANWEYFMKSLVGNMTLFYEKYPNLELIGLPMQMGVEGSDDYRTLTEFKRRLKRKNDALPFNIEKPHTIEDMAFSINMCDFVVSERLHCLIMSAIIGKPFLALEYDPKVVGVIEDFGFKKFGIDINKKFHPTLIFDLMSKLITDSANFRRRLLRKTGEHQSKANLSFDMLVDNLNELTRKK
jgi:polysaccharide pyruvyl transferase WcaK-like protein